MLSAKTQDYKLQTCEHSADILTYRLTWLEKPWTISHEWHRRIFPATAKMKPHVITLETQQRNNNY